ncbi:MAG TPA: hypothetical protein VGE22_06975 [Solimonas sp.]
MSSSYSSVSIAVFGLTLAATFLMAWLGRRHGGSDHGGLAEQKLNRWLIGLSAGAAANSGFIVTGAVGLGYVFGMQWVLLPLSWLVGDIVFWALFPQRLNDFGRRSRATTLPELLTHGLQGRGATLLALICGALILVCLSGYVSAQWLAGQKFIAGAFPISGLGALALFAVLIIAYTSIGGFRGSVYVDSLQAVIRIIGTALALFAVFWVAHEDGAIVQQNLAAAGPGFLSLLPAGGWPAAAGFVLGFGAAALGFGLGQPHIVSRYLAGASPAETRSAWWIYMGFVQFTWIAMTLFGVMLRGVMPDLQDPEAGLSLFFSHRMNAVATGIIVADVFATIAATSNALLVAMAQTLSHDLLSRAMPGRRFPIAWGCALMGALTMALSLVLRGSVMQMALDSVAMMAAGIAPAVMAKVLGWRHDARSLILSVLAGLVAAGAWKLAGLDPVVNQAAAGIAAGVLALRLAAPRDAARDVS